MTRRSPEVRPGCSARYHDRPSDYDKHGCRCAAVAYAYSLQRQRRALGRQPAGIVPAVASVRIVRGLYAAGHDAATIADAAGLTAATVRILAGRRSGEVPDTIHRATAEAITRAAAHLARLPSRYAGRKEQDPRRRAARGGWAPLHAWDGDVFRLDDPDADDTLARDTLGLDPSHRRVIRDEKIRDDARAAELHRARVEAGRRARAAENPAALAARAARAGRYRWAENGAQRSNQAAKTDAPASVLPYREERSA